MRKASGKSAVASSDLQMAYLGGSGVRCNVNLPVLAILFVPGAKVQAALHAGIVERCPVRSPGLITTYILALISFR